VYTEEELASMRLQFQRIDTDGTGTLNPEELAAFTKLYSIDGHLVNLAFLLFDTSCGGITFEKFIQFMDFAHSFDKNPRAFYRRVYDAIDRDKSGALSPAELREFCSLIGHEISHSDAINVIKSMDFTGTGALIFDDLCHWLGLPRSR
jgi:Ca2+-binding EF-hand superfamily protein